MRHTLNNLYWELGLSCLHKHQFFPPEGPPDICIREPLDEFSVLMCCQDRDYCNCDLNPKFKKKPTGLLIIYVCPFNRCAVYLVFPTNILGLN